MSRIAEHQRRLAEGEKVARHLRADHRDLVQHEQLAVAHRGLGVEHEPRLVRVLQPELERAQPRLLEQLLCNPKRMQASANPGGFLFELLDLLRCRLGDAVHQRMDSRGRRALAGHHESRLACEGRVEHQSYVGRVLRLTLLAPDIIEAILGGRQPAEMTLAALMRPFPVEWEAQRIEKGHATLDVHAGWERARN